MEMNSKALLTGSRYGSGMRTTITAAFLLLALPASAQPVSGPARAADGDSLDLTAITVRLFGVDAPRCAQRCDRGGSSWGSRHPAASQHETPGPGLAAIW